VLILGIMLNAVAIRCGAGGDVGDRQGRSLDNAAGVVMWLAMVQITG
jgi:hypothetical protein